MGRPRTKTGSGSSPPTTELGVAVPSIGSHWNILTGRPAPWHAFVDSNEYVTELRWPASVPLYNQMRTDSQISGLYTAVAYGIQQLRFLIDPNGARPEAVQGVAEDLNLPVKDEQNQPKRRLKRRFAHQKHLSQALLSLIYGHMYFEQVGEIVDGLWRLRKLAPRMPEHIDEITVADDGGLVSIRQSIGASPDGSRPPELPVDRLVGYIFQQEGANWVGRSILRDCYKNWLIKDRLLRVDAINHERAGGVPFFEAAAEATPGEVTALREAAKEFRVGETAGGAVPYGTELNIIRGTGSDVAGSIRMHDEAMARRFLLMVANLAQGGQHVGSYSLGEVFKDFFTLGQKAIVQWYCDVVNEHIIEDWVDWNVGEDEELSPILTWDGEDEVLGIDALVQLVDSEVIVVDEEIEDAIRYKYRLPRRSAPRPAATASDGDAGAQGEGAPSLPAAPAEPDTSAALERVLGRFDALERRINERVEAIAAGREVHQEQQPVHLHLELEKLDITPPEVQVDAPNVQVYPPDIHLQPEVKVDVHTPKQRIPRSATIKKLEDGTTVVNYEYEDEDG